MRPETEAFLGKSRECLEKANWMIQRYPDEAGREAYLAGLHAAQALIIERTGHVAKTHKGVQRELTRLTKDDAGFDLELRAFLGRSYNLKAIADYEFGPGSKVTEEQAASAIITNHRFVAAISGLLSIDGRLDE